MKIRNVLFLILLVLMLSLTTATLTQQNNQTPAWALTQTIALQQPIPKGMTIKWITNETLANTNTTNYQYAPSVCCFPNGSGFVVAWRGQGEADSYDIWAKIFNSTGHNQTDDILVSGNTTRTQGDPSVCCFSNGFVVAWHSDHEQSLNYEVYAKIFDSNGVNLTKDILVNGNTTDYQWFPSVCCFSNGFVVAWYSYQTGNYDVYAKVFNSTTGENTTDDILVNTYTAGNQWRPSVCCFSNSDFVVVWDDSNNIFARIFNSSGDPKTNDIQVNTYEPTYPQYPDVCCFSSGFIVAWHGTPPGDASFDIWAKMFNLTGHNQTADIQVNDYTPAEQAFPSVCCFDNGSFVVAWSSVGQDGSGKGVYAKFIDSTGHKQTGDIQVNVNSLFDQSEPSVCCFSNASLVVAWSNYWNSSDYDTFFRIGEIQSLPGISPLFAVFLFTQFQAGISVPLLVGGILVVAVVGGVIAYLLFKRRSVVEHPEGKPPKPPKAPKAPPKPPKAPPKAPKKWTAE